MSDDQAIDVVQRFCAAWGDGDLDAIVEFFTEDAVYHNIPLDPVTGKDAIRATIAGFTQGVDKIEFRVDHIAGAGDGHVVMTERVDIFSLPGKTVSLPVMGAFEVRDGRIAALTTFFDTAYAAALAAGPSAG